MDGYLQARGNSIYISVSQTYPAILDAFSKQFGGGRSKSEWYLLKGASRLLKAIAPFMIEKRQQADLLLNMNGNGAYVQRLLRQFKGNQTKKSTFLAVFVLSNAPTAKAS